MSSEEGPRPTVVHVIGSLAAAASDDLASLGGVSVAVVDEVPAPDSDACRTHTMRCVLVSTFFGLLFGKAGFGALPWRWKHAFGSRFGAPQRRWELCKRCLSFFFFFFFFLFLNTHCIPVCGSPISQIPTGVEGAAAWRVVVLAAEDAAEAADLVDGARNAAGDTAYLILFTIGVCVAAYASMP